MFYDCNCPSSNREVKLLAKPTVGDQSLLLQADVGFTKTLLGSLYLPQEGQAESRLALADQNKRETEGLAKTNFVRFHASLSRSNEL